MEMLVVVAIIVALAGMGGYYFLGQANQARKGTAKGQIKTLEQAVDNYKLDHRDQTPAALTALLTKDEYGGPYLKNQDALIDPWGKPFNYNPAGSRNNGLYPDIFAIAPDGTEIGNWASRGITEP